MQINPVPRPLTGSRLVWISCCLTLLAASALSAQQPPEGAQGTPIDQEPAVVESIEVVEARTLIEVPRLKRSQRESLTASDFLVEEGGLLRTVMGVTPHSLEDDPWNVLVYFDLLLTDARTVALSARELAARADQLTALGPVRVVTSAATTLEWSPAGRDEQALVTALHSIADSRSGRDALRILRRASPDADTTATDILEEESFFLRERADALLLEAGECTVTPCLLVLVSGGFDTLPGVHYPDQALKEAPPVHAALATETGQMLAGMGWTVLATPLAPPEEPEKRQSRTVRTDVGTDYYAWKQEAGGVQMAPPPRKGNRFSGAPANAFDVHLQARLQTLRDWGAASTGVALRTANQLDRELARLRSGRLWVTYQTAAQGPSIRRLNVRLSEAASFQESREWKERLALVPDEEPLRAPSAAVFGVPAALSDARVRELAFGRRLSGSIELEQIRSGSEVLGVRWLGVSDEERVRVSILDLEGELSHRFETLSGDANHRVLLDIEETGWILVEDLLTRAWGAVTLSGGAGVLDMLWRPDPQLEQLDLSDEDERAPDEQSEEPPAQP